MDNTARLPPQAAVPKPAAMPDPPKAGQREVAGGRGFAAALHLAEVPAAVPAAGRQAAGGLAAASSGGAAARPEASAADAMAGPGLAASADPAPADQVPVDPVTDSPSKGIPTTAGAVRPAAEVPWSARLAAQPRRPDAAVVPPGMPEAETDADLDEQEELAEALERLRPDDAALLPGPAVPPTLAPGAAPGAASIPDQATSRGHDGEVPPALQGGTSQGEGHFVLAHPAVASPVAEPGPQRVGPPAEPPGAAPPGPVVAAPWAGLPPSGAAAATPAEVRAAASARSPALAGSALAGVPGTTQPDAANPGATRPGAMPLQAGHRPMALAAAAGQAVAVEAKAEPGGVSPAGLVEQPSEAASPVEAAPAAMAVAEVVRPEPLASLAASPSATVVQPTSPGLSPAPAAPPPVQAPPPARAAPPPPPARQVAQVTIALALGSGQAPRLTVALEPESLGRVEIRIERGAEGEAASVRVLAERPETLALLQRDARDLDRALSQAGVTVAEGGLQFGLSSGGSGQQGGQPRSGAGGWAGWEAVLPAETHRPGTASLALLDIAV